eukprot:scaffold69846_cov17-Tisochrysis_lutea.AAC.1
MTWKVFHVQRPRLCASKDCEVTHAHTHTHATNYRAVVSHESLKERNHWVRGRFGALCLRAMAEAKDYWQAQYRWFNCQGKNKEQKGRNAVHLSQLPALKGEFYLLAGSSKPSSLAKPKLREG